MSNLLLKSILHCFNFFYRCPRLWFTTYCPIASRRVSSTSRSWPRTIRTRSWGPSLSTSAWPGRSPSSCSLRGLPSGRLSQWFCDHCLILSFYVFVGHFVEKKATLFLYRLSFYSKTRLTPAGRFFNQKLSRGELFDCEKCVPSRAPPRHITQHLRHKGSKESK